MERVTVRSKHLDKLVEWCLKNNNGAFYQSYLEPIVNDMQKDRALQAELKEHFDDELETTETPVIEG